MTKSKVIYDVYHQMNSSSSDSSSPTSSSENSTPLKRFNRLVRVSVARHWPHFRRSRQTLRTRGRSVSDAGLCSIVDNDPDLHYLDMATVPARLSLQVYDKGLVRALPSIFARSTGGTGSSVGFEEHSDGSDAEKPRKGYHLRVPTPAFPGQSTGNFPAGAAGGGCGAPRSAPATPLQLEPHPPRHVKAEKTHVVKPLSGSAPSVRVAALGGAEDATDEKQPYKSRQKKFQRHFPQVGPEERVLNYYSCALVGDLLLQGHLYITKNYFAFYSNVFGYVTKLLIPTTSVLRITKEKVARIIPNAVGVCTRDERHVFGSLLSRDSTYKLMTHVWKAARATEPDIPKSKDLRTDHEPSEYSPEDDSSSAGGDHHDAPAPPVRRESEAIITGSAAVIQPALLTGTTSPPEKPSHWRTFLIAATIVLSLSALVMAYRLFVIGVQTEDDIMGLSGDDLYEELVKYRTRLHGRAANEMHAFLTTNLLLLTKVRQSLEALSGVILSDLSRADDLHVNLDVPNDTAFS